MAQGTFANYRGFSDPLEVTDRTDMTYEARLALLQEWRASLVTEGAAEEAVAEVDGAIQALEMGAEVQDDAPEAPEGRPKGKVYGAACVAARGLIPAMET